MNVKKMKTRKQEILEFITEMAKTDYAGGVRNADDFSVYDCKEDIARKFGHEVEGYEWPSEQEIEDEYKYTIEELAEAAKQ